MVSSASSVGLKYRVTSLRPRPGIGRKFTFSRCWFEIGRNRTSARSSKGNSRMPKRPDLYLTTLQEAEAVTLSHQGRHEAEGDHRRGQHPDHDRGPPCVAKIAQAREQADSSDREPPEGHLLGPRRPASRRGPCPAPGRGPATRPSGPGRDPLDQDRVQDRVVLRALDDLDRGLDLALWSRSSGGRRGTRPWRSRRRDGPRTFRRPGARAGKVPSPLPRSSGPSRSP